MPTNIEIKARVSDRAAVLQRLESLADREGELLRQVDTFYHCPRGRLKLRTINDERSELIFYTRPDQSGPKTSDYVVTPVAEPASMRELLSRLFEVRGVVKKTRRLYMVGQTRVHLDSVEGLGEFLELEVVLRPEQSEQEGVLIARELMAKLGIEEENLVEGAYVDLMEEGA